jgi:peptidoglycan/xylan/chitin deacetylase (PgdA/CDA1 family)
VARSARALLPPRVDRSVTRAAWHLRSMPWWRSSPPRRLKDLRPRSLTRDTGIALTFDDGPDPAYTPRVLESLSDLGVRATFFMCGLAATRHPDLVRSVAAEGHTVAGHTWTHRDVRGLSDEEWRTEVDATNHLLEGITGTPVRYFRPPWCTYDRTVLDRLRSSRLVPVLFSASGDDWLTTDPETIARNVINGMQPGAIVLLHDACGDLLLPGGTLSSGTQSDRTGTIDALPAIVRATSAAGLRCVPLPA